MENFTFQNPTKLIVGKGTIANLATEIPKDKKILITFGGGSVKSNGVYDQVKAALAAHNTIEFWGIEANPTFQTLSKAVKIGKEEKIDFLLAVGGGSVLDGTKFIASAIPYEGDGWELVLNNSLIKETVPFASVITLPATGSEMNNGAVISNTATNEKFPLFSAFPQFSILDPETTYSLPKFQISCGIVDTFIHTMEQYLTYPSQAMVMDRWAEGLLLTLIELAPKIQADQHNYDTMSNYMLTATLALNGFISMGVPQDWATHFIGHELTALKGLTHGLTLAIVYPAMLRVRKEEKREKLLQYAKRVWNITEGTEDERMNKAIAMTEAFFRMVGLPTRLNEVEVDLPIIDEIVSRFEKRGTVLGERSTVTPMVVREILMTAL